MKSNTYILTAANGLGGFEDIIFDRSNLGFTPSESHTSFQVSCEGLDGGTYSVLFRPKGSRSHVIFVEGATQGDAVLLEQKFLFDEVKITFVNLGAGAAPKVIGTFIMRGF